MAPPMYLSFRLDDPELSFEINTMSEEAYQKLADELKSPVYIYFQENTGSCHCVGVYLTRVSEHPPMHLLHTDALADEFLVPCSVHHARVSGDNVLSVRRDDAEVFKAFS
eukprot:NODE_1483_length_841_cov_74.296919_g1435_i0.p1 GENE.NODE_1483_length_841_cov_74.296919_g1435_i0~~NODE_1483_length_841_cov_74.296919_g1435_i0.p1  ORF type:complete len:110 (+),score=16.28 NODE_1483_length_841_cov_74.296919_g1435_i0:71-400(+)